MSPSDARRWARAYAIQARADRAAYAALTRERALPRCQALHFLQMCCEKLAKAHLFQTKTALTGVQTSHAYVAKNLPLVLRATYERQQRKSLDVWLLQGLRSLAREIELLAPAVDAGGGRPDNCEYPWVDPVGQIHTPAEHPFLELDLNTPAGIMLLKLLPLAIEEALRVS